MKWSGILAVTAASVLLSSQLAMAVPFDVTTGDIASPVAHGADTFVNNSEADINHGAETLMIAWDWWNPGPEEWLWYKTYVRFAYDFNPEMPDGSTEPLTSATLTCTTLDGQFPPGTTIWGLDDGDPGENWDELGITWNNAPANDTAGNGLLSNATYLGEFNSPELQYPDPAAAGGTGDFSGDALKDFLNADTNSLATLMILSPGETGVPALTGDLNDDAFVGQADLDIVLAMWGNGPIIPDPRADVNEDEFVGQTDLDYVLAEWGQVGGPPYNNGFVYLGVYPYSPPVLTLDRDTPTAPAVPEPATLGLVGLGALSLLRRSRG